MNLDMVLTSPVHKQVEDLWWIGIRHPISYHYQCNWTRSRGM